MQFLQKFQTKLKPKTQPDPQLKPPKPIFLLFCIVTMMKFNLDTTLVRSLCL